MRRKEPSVQLRNAVNDLYAALDEKYRPTQILGAENSELINRLLNEDRKTLTGSDFEDYAYSVLCLNPVPNEFKYFLPRFLEIDCCREGPWDMPSADAYLRNIADSEWASWPKIERDALLNLCRKVFEEPEGYYIDITSWLKGIAYIEEDITPYLRLLENKPSCIHQISWIINQTILDKEKYEMLKRELEGRLFFDKGFEKAEEQLQAWLASPEIQTKIQSYKP